MSCWHWADSILQNADGSCSTNLTRQHCRCGKLVPRVFECTSYLCEGPSQRAQTGLQGPNQARMKPLHNCHSSHMVECSCLAHELLLCCTFHASSLCSKVMLEVYALRWVHGQPCLISPEDSHQAVLGCAGQYLSCCMTEEPGEIPNGCDPPTQPAWGLKIHITSYTLQSTVSGYTSKGCQLIRKQSHVASPGLHLPHGRTGSNYMRL